MIELKLTPEQVKAIRPLLVQARDEAAVGRRGMVLAQLSFGVTDSLRVGFIPSQKALGIARIMTQQEEPQRRARS